MKELEQTKFKERLDFAIAEIKARAEKEKIPFDKELLRESSEIARMLYVRSEIAYSTQKR